MAKELRIPVVFPVEVDERSLDSAFDHMGSLWSDVEDDGRQAFQHVADDVDLVSDAIAGLPDFDFDTGGGQDISDLAARFNEVRDSGEAMVTQQKLALAALVAAGDQGSDAYLDLVASIIDTKQQIKDVEAAQQHVVDLFQEPIDIKVNPPDPEENPFEQMFKFEAIEKAGAFFEGVSERASELRASEKALVAQTGLTGEALDDLKSRSFDAFTSGIGENMAEATQIMGKAQQQLGALLDAPGIDAFVTKMSGVKAAFGVELDDSVSKSTSFIKAWGLEGDQAADLIALGMQKAKTPSDDYLDTIAEYSPLLKDAGFSAEEFNGVLIKGAQEGAFSLDKLGDAAKETSIRLKAGDISTALGGISAPITDTIKDIVKAGEQGTISVKEVMQRAAAETERAFQAGEIGEQIRSQLQVAISGTPAEDLGTELYARVFGAPIDTDSITSQATLAGTQMADAIEPTFGTRIGKMFSAIGDKASVLVAPLADAAGVALSTTAQLGPALSFLKNADLLPIDKIKSFASEMGGLSGIASKVGPAMSSAFTLATGPIGLTIAGIAAVTAALVYFFSSTEDGQAIWADITDAVSDFIDLATPAFEEIGGILLTIGKIVLEILIQPFELLWDVISGIFTAVGSLASELLGATSGSDSLKSSFEILDDVFATVRISLEAVLAGFRAMKEGVGDVISKLLSGDIVGALKSASNLGDKVSTAFNDAVEQGTRDHLGDKLQHGLDSALKNKQELDIKLKASIDVNSTLASLQKAENEIGGLQDKLSKAKIGGGSDTEIAKLSKELEGAKDKARGFAEQLEKDAPGTTRIIGTEVTATGELKKVYSVNKQAVADMANAKQAAFGAQAQAEVQNYSKNLEGVAAQYEQQRSELDTLQAQINKGGASPEMLKRFDELVTKTNASGESMKKAFTDGAKQGLLTDSAIRQMAKSLGISEGEARKLVAQQRENAKQAGIGKKNIDELGASFGEAMKKAQDEVSKLSAAYAEMLRTGENDPSIIENLRKAQAELSKLTKIQATAAETPEQIAKRAADAQKSAEDLAANREERQLRRNLRLIRNEDDRALKEIEITRNMAIRREQIEINYQTKLLALNESTDANASASAAIKQAQDNQAAARSEAQLAREEKLGEIAVKNAEKLLELEKTRFSTETANIQQRLDLLKASGAKGSAILQQQQDLERSIIERGLADQKQATIDATEEMQKFRSDLLAGVAIAPSDPNNSPERVAQRLADQRAVIAKRLTSGTDPIALAYQSLFEASARKILDSEVAVRQEGLQQELTDIQSHLSQVEGETLKSVRERNRLQLEEMDKLQQIELEKTVQGLLAQEIVRIRGQQLAGTITKDDADAQVAAARLQVLSLSKEVAELKERQAKARTSLLATQAQAEQSKLLEELSEGNDAVAASLALRTSAYDAFYGHIDEQRRADLQAQKDALTEQSDALISSLQDGSLSINDFFEQRAEMAAKQREIDEELAASTFDFWKSVGQATAPAFQSMIDNHRKALDTATADFEKGTLSFGDLAGDLAVTLGGLGAKAALEQQNIADAVIGGAFDMLTSLVPILSSMILGYSLATPTAIATLGASALIEWALLTGLLEAAVAATRAAVGYHDAGYTGDGWEWDVAGVVHRREFVHGAEVTADPVNRDLFEHLHEGGDLWAWFAEHEQRSNYYVGEDGALAERSDLDITNALKHGRDMRVVVESELMLKELREQTKLQQEGNSLLAGIKKELEEMKAKLLTLINWATLSHQEQEKMAKVLGYQRGYTSDKLDLMGAVVAEQALLKQILEQLQEAV